MYFESVGFRYNSKRAMMHSRNPGRISSVAKALSTLVRNKLKSSDFQRDNECLDQPGLILDGLSGMNSNCKCC